MNSVEGVIARAYVHAKPAFPDEGRRKWKIRAVDHFWNSMSAERAGEEDKTMTAPPWASDPDPFDLADGTGDGGLVSLKGVVVRTDYSDEEAWKKFKEILEQSEKEGLEELKSAMDKVGDEEMKSDEADEEGEEDVEMEETSNPQDDADDKASTDESDSIFHIVNLPPNRRDILENATNLTLLRLFCDVVIIPEPPPPAQRDNDMLFASAATKGKGNTKTASAKNRLAGLNGWKEAYTGRIIWVYDKQSNQDSAVRLVDGGMNATRSSTGDSWRVKGSRIWELQVNLDSGALKVDFGGADRWTWEERRRNYEEIGVVLHI